MEESFPVPTKPLEFIALLVVELSTKEGAVFMYVAYDPYLDKLFNLSVEKENNPTNLLKSIYNLADDPMFSQYNTDGFSLILENQEELSKRIETILRPINGRCIFNKAYNNYLTQPVIKSLRDFLKNRKK
jgi:hypothetical protein